MDPESEERFFTDAHAKGQHLQKQPCRHIPSKTPVVYPLVVGFERAECFFYHAQSGLHWTAKSLGTECPLNQEGLLGCSGDLVSRLSNGPYGASYGLLWGLIRDTKWTY